MPLLCPGSGSWDVLNNTTLGQPAGVYPSAPWQWVFVPPGFMLAFVLGAALLSPGVRRLPPHVLLMTAVSASTPMMDTTSDVIVTASFAAGGDWVWFAVAAADLGFAGVFGMLGTYLALALGKLDEAIEALPRCVQGPTTAACYALGFAGLSPLLFATGLLYRAGTDGGKKDSTSNEAVTLRRGAKAYAGFSKMLELVSETTPQATLQGYVAVSYGMLDPIAAQFNPAFAASLSVSTLTAALTLVGTDADTLAISDKALRPAHAAALLAWRMSETVSRVFTLALFACAFKGHAYFALLAEGAAQLAVSAARGDIDGGGMGMRLMWSLCEGGDLDRPGQAAIWKEIGGGGWPARIALALLAPVWLPMIAFYYMHTVTYATAVTDGTRLSELSGDKSRGYACTFFGVRAAALGAMAAVFYATPHASNDHASKGAPIPVRCGTCRLLRRDCARWQQP